MKNPLLPPGLCDKSKCEIFVKDNVLHAVYQGMVMPWTGLPAHIQNNFLAEFRASNLCDTIIGLFPNIKDKKQAFARWLSCNFGGFDNTPDYADRHKESEHWDCGHRGKCAAEGIVCQSHSLSAKEVEVVRLLAEGLPDKLIADKLSISINTVITHEKRIRKKIKAYNRIEIMRFAIENNYLN